MARRSKSNNDQQQQPAPPPPPGGYAAPAGYGPPPGYEGKRKRRFYTRVWFILLVIVVVVAIIVIVSVSNAVKKGTSAPHTVVYSVTGSGSADITYLNLNGDGTTGSEQRNGAKLPFAVTVHGKGDFSEYTLTGQKKSGGSGAIACSVKVDGVVKSKQTSTGPYAVVSCSASGSS